MCNMEPRVIYSQPNIPVWISGNFQWRMDLNLLEYIWKKEELCEVYPKFWKFLTENFRFIEFFSRLFKTDFFGWMVGISESQQFFFLIFQKLNISVHLLQLRNFRNLCLNGKRPSLFLMWLTFDRWNVIGLVTITRKKEQLGMTYTKPMSRISAWHSVTRLWLRN